MRVSNVSRKRLARSDLIEAASSRGNVPLIAQLVGNDRDALVAAARNIESAGARHLNLNLGCPFGRMTTGATGGAMLQEPELLAEIIEGLRRAISGTFSIKLRAGYEDPEQIFSLLPLFEENHVDFLILHPRTVVQKYAGRADHSITRRVVETTPVPVIANGDINSAREGLRVLHETAAAGLMLGRGAIADPLLIQRLRNGHTAEPPPPERAVMVRGYLEELLIRYRELFCGERQVLDKVKNVVAFMEYPAHARELAKLKRAKSIAAFTEILANIE